VAGTEGVARASTGRNRYVDFLRVSAIGFVVLGHWLVTAVTYRAGQFQGEDVLTELPWTQWLTLVFQVVPVFFLVGGYANAASLRSHRARGGNGGSWLQRRVVRLLAPTTAYVGLATLAVAAWRATGANPTTLATAGWAVALHLWFLPVYLFLLSMTPMLHAAHRRWGLLVPATLAAAAAAVDTAVLVDHLRLLGWVNYILVWGAVHQMGFAWQDGTLAGHRHRLLALAAAEAPLSRWLRRPRLWQAVSRANRAAMTVYLWHMAPVVVAAVILYPTGLMAQPVIGSATWWGLRVVWVAVLAALFAPLLAALGPLEGLLNRPRTALDLGAPHGWVLSLLVAGIPVVAYALARFAIGGFAPGGQLPVTTLAAYCLGVLLILTASMGSRAGRPARSTLPRPARSR